MAKGEGEEKITMTKKEFEDLLAQAKAEIKAEVSREVKAEKAEIPEEEKEMWAQIEEEKKHLNDPVTIQIFKDGNKYKDDVFVGVNGKTFLIQRGVPVTVPRYVANVLQESQAQDLEAAAYAEAQQREFKEASVRLNI